MNLVMNYAELGSVSSGALRTDDLIDAFTSELEFQLDRNEAAWNGKAGRAKRNALVQLIWDAREANFANGPWDYTYVNELIDALDEFAGPNCYFGAHVGDGADFGFWSLQ